MSIIDDIAVLLVDHDTDFINTISALFQNFHITIAHSFHEAIQQTTEQSFDLIICNDSLQENNSLLEHIHAHHIDSEVIIITENANIDSVLKAVHVQVSDYFIKSDVTEQLLQSSIHICQSRIAQKRKQKILVDELKNKNKTLESLAKELLESNQQLQALTTRDPTTGLFNHVYFQQYLNREIDRSKRYNHQLALLMIDIDHYKRINTLYGHIAGDRLLCDVAAIFHGQISDDEGKPIIRDYDLSARYGGDQFAIILPETNTADAASVAESIRKAVSAIFISNTETTCTISCGLAVYPHDAKEKDQLIEAAKHALHIAKQDGGNKVITHHVEMDDNLRDYKASHSLAIKRLQALEESMQSKAFTFVYQPIVKADTFDIFAYEALCRPSHSAFSSPLELFQTAERAGKISELGTALRHLIVEPVNNIDTHTLLFVNLHPFELQNPVILDIAPQLEPWRNRLVYEVTESRAITNYKQVNRTFKRLKEMGIRIALDDIGSGYSGLNSLALLDADFIKLDMNMLRDIPANSRRSRLIKHIIEYAKDEGMIVIAEGIETSQECKVVTEIGIPLLQGFFFAKGSPPFIKPDKKRIFEKLNEPDFD